MKLAKALKLKNKLAGDITSLRSQLKKAEADKIVAEIEAEIAALQDALDEFNNSTSIEV